LVIRSAIASTAIGISPAAAKGRLLIIDLNSVAAKGLVPTIASVVANESIPND